MVNPWCQQFACGHHRCGWWVGLQPAKREWKWTSTPNMGTHLLAQCQESRWAVLLLKLCLQARSAGPRGAGLNKMLLRCCSSRLSYPVLATQWNTPEGSHSGSLRNRSAEVVVGVLIVGSPWEMRVINPRTWPSKQDWAAFKVSAVNMPSVQHGCRDGPAPDSSSSDTSSLVRWEYPTSLIISFQQKMLRWYKRNRRNHHS